MKKISTYMGILSMVVILLIGMSVSAGAATVRVVKPVYHGKKVVTPVYQTKKVKVITPAYHGQKVKKVRVYR